MREPKTEYQYLKLSTGTGVRVRPRTYAEWESQEEERLKLLEAVSALTDEDARNLALQRATLTVRNTVLTAWVEGFAEKKAGLSLREAAEIERFVQKLEEGEIPLGNSETGGAGQ